MGDRHDDRGGQHRWSRSSGAVAAVFKNFESESVTHGFSPWVAVESTDWLGVAAADNSAGDISGRRQR